MDSNRPVNAVLNGLSFALLGYILARLRGRDSPRRSALRWGVVGTLVSYVALGRADFEELEAVEAVDPTADVSEPVVVGSAVEHVMGFEDEDHPATARSDD